MTPKPVYGSMPPFATTRKPRPLHQHVIDGRRRSTITVGRRGRSLVSDNGPPTHPLRPGAFFDPLAPTMFPGREA